MVTPTRQPRHTPCPASEQPSAFTVPNRRPAKGDDSSRQMDLSPDQLDRVSALGPRCPRKATRHAEPFSVNKSPGAVGSSANFDSVDSCKQKRQRDRLQLVPAMKQSQPYVVRDSKDMTMSAVINRGGGRPSKGLRKYIGFRTQAKTAEDVQMIAAAKGMTVTDYVSSAVDRSLREDLALLDHFAQQEELPIRIAS